MKISEKVSCKWHGNFIRVFDEYNNRTYSAIGIDEESARKNLNIILRFLKRNKLFMH